MKHFGLALIDPSIVFEEIGLAEGMRVADLGCGRTGQFVFPTAAVVGDKGIVYAVDVIQSVLENIQHNARSAGFTNIETIWADLEKVGQTPIPTASLNVCFLVNVLFSVHDMGSVIFEAGRLLKSGGALVVIDWKKPLGNLQPPAILNPDDIKSFASKSDLFFSGTAEPGEYHFCLIFKKV